VEVTGKVLGEAGAGGRSSALDAVGFFGVGLFEDDEGLTETGGVLLGDGKDSNAALATAWVADQVMATALIGISHYCVYDLDEI
jgi:hypothetical protein